MSTQGKTPREWAEYLPEPIRTHFLENVNPLLMIQHPTENIERAIFDWFTWSDTKQGRFYWNEVYKRALNGEFSKPIPKIEPKPTEQMTAVEWIFIDEEKPSIEDVGKLFLVAVKKPACYEYQIAEWWHSGCEEDEPYFLIEQSWIGQQMMTREVTHWCELIELPSLNETFGGDK